MAFRDLTGNVIEPELGQHVLNELADLNADFIDLITAIDSTGQEQLRLVLPEEQLEQLRRLRKPAIRRLTSCAFALFDFRLQDEELWRSVGKGKFPYTTITRDDNERNRRVRLFTLSALMYLRHLADVNRFFAKLSFGASPAALDVISTLPLNQLREVAERYPALLGSRFEQHPQAWTDLLKLAKRNDTEPMLPAKILGYKHLYQE